MMVFHTDRGTLRSHLRPLSVLVLHLLLTHSCRGQSRLIGSSQPIVATVGDDIILPCHLEPAVDIAAMTLDWTRPDLDPEFVFVWRAGQDLVHLKHPSYRGRTSVFTDELKRGNISLKLSDVRLSDAGSYVCFIPRLNVESFIELVVGAVSPPFIVSINITSSGVVLQCECAGWYPEPEVLWLDGEGKLLSAGPTETVRGPDDLYTVSSRVTVEKRHSNSFTCRVQQRNINQARETHVYISEDFSNLKPTITGLAVSLVVCIMLILLLLSVVWKWRPNKNKTGRSSCDETGDEEKKICSDTNRNEDQNVTEEERDRLMSHETEQMNGLSKGEEKEKTKHLCVRRPHLKCLMKKNEDSERLTDVREHEEHDDIQQEDSSSASQGP